MTTGNSRQNLDAKRFDVVIIGGGINGAAIARECVRARKSVLLVEQNDFGSGTTSRSTRIIHGGLRYLEHGELSLVRESLHERERLLAENGNLVRPLNFLLALPPESRRSALTVRFGLWLYGRIAARKTVLNHREDRKRLEALLDRGQRWSVFAYEDAQCEYPERLIIEWLLEAATFGAVLRNYTDALEVQRSNGSVIGVRLRDRLSGSEFVVGCEWVINASGPWADAVCRRSNLRTDDPLIGGVRGSHILLPMMSGAPEAAVYTEAIDGRPIFVIPWAGQLMVGTTEVRDTGDPGQATPSSNEIAYLITSFQRLFPSAGYNLTDVRAAFAGIRPLPYVTERTPNSVTRRHFLIEHSDEGARRMISIIGGKLTTAASLARQCVRAMGIKVAEPAGYAVFPAEISRRAMDGESPDSIEAIASLFGKATPQVLKVLQQDDCFRQPICPHTDHLVGDAVYAARNEYTVTLADILLRRVPVALGPCWSQECTRVAAQRIGLALNWSAHTVGKQAEDFEQEYIRFLRTVSTIQ